MRTGALVFIAGLTCFAADPDLLRLAMPNARFLSGIQVARSAKTPFGQYVLSQMQPDDEVLQKFLVDSGFDARRDLTKILIAASGDAESPTSLMIARGTFHPEQFAAAAKSHGAAETTYRGTAVLSMKGAKSEGAVAFLDSSTALVGDRPGVEAAIDRQRSGPATSPEIAARVNELSAAYDAWFLSTGPIGDYLTGKLADENLGEAVHGNLLSSVLDASGGLRFEQDGVRLAAQAFTKSEKDAGALGDVLRFLAGLVQVNKGPGPKTTLAKSLQLTADGNVLRISLAMPEAVAERLFIPKQTPSR